MSMYRLTLVAAMTLGLVCFAHSDLKGEGMWQLNGGLDARLSHIHWDGSGGVSYQPARLRSIASREPWGASCARSCSESFGSISA